MSVEKENELKKVIIDTAIEAWRFKDTFSRAMEKLDAGEKNKYLGKYNWLMRKVDSGLEAAGLKAVNIEGQKYDSGFAVTPINIEDFEDKDILYVKNMLEPIIMEGDKVFKAGLVRLGKVEI